MSFHIGSQTAQVITNVDGDFHGNVQVGAPPEMVGDLARAVAAIPLDRARGRFARRELDDLAEAARAPRPERARMAGALTRLTRLLQGAGALLAAAAPLLAPLKALALWLGPLGLPVLALLP
ncbi:hypothetical protein GCM10009836_13580 [Pseudonocardia ailaonensis]|uniref:Uncharacterized protein n=1 Tax=Pseudonocardia ailaonensis TaxID=367279 RepID=A0ABN2MT29_9PSEU